GADQPGRQCDQVHRTGLGGGGAVERAGGGWTRAVAVQRGGQRHRHRARGDRADVPGIPPDGGVDQPAVRRQRPGAGDQPAAGGADGWDNRGGERAERGQHVPLRGDAEAGRAAAGGGRGGGDGCGGGGGSGGGGGAGCGGGGCGGGGRGRGRDRG